MALTKGFEKMALDTSSWVVSTPYGSNWFKDLKMRNKLFLAFLVMISLLVLISAVALIGQNRVTTTVDDLINRDFRLTELSLKSDVAMLMARRGEKDYLLRYKEVGFEEANLKYVTQVKTEAANLRQNMLEVKNLGIDKQVTAQAEAVDQAITEYETTFLATVAQIEKRGYVDSGIEGQFREKVHEIETAVDSNHLDNTLLVDLLTMRRHEKDYLLRGDEKYIVKLHETVVQFKKDLSGVDLNPSEKEHLVTLADEYQALFDQLTQLDMQIAANTEAFRQAVPFVTS